MKNLYKGIFIIGMVIIFNFIFLNPADAKNDCKRDGCKITITMNMVFVGATQAQIDKWVKEIETVWDSPTTGKCSCDVSFKVSATSAPSCTAAAAQGRHCIEVTLTNPKDNNNKEYKAFMWGLSQNGSSISGKWGPGTSEKIPGSITIGGQTYTPSANENYVDAAHEAGHILGLPDEYNAAAGSYPNNLMGRTWGPDAKPNQGHIDKAVANNCKGEDAKCPDECCCGRNGKVDTDPKEECDPSATPTGCKEMESCDKNCKCLKMKATPICGDGYVTKPEEQCEPDKKPTGCAADENCVGCKCSKKTSPITTPSNPLVPIIPETPDLGTQTPSEPDNDGDGIKDSIDNCPNNTNANQADKDNDDIGDTCDSCTDIDHDTYSQEGGICGIIDCNDNNVNIYPGKAEDCTDGADNDCDGKTDSADSNCVIDSDGDGVSDNLDNCDNTANANQSDIDNDGLGDACDPCIDRDRDGYNIPGGGSCGTADCDDNNAAVYPGKAEIMDGIDNNCDGLIDNITEPTCGDGIFNPVIEPCDQSAPYNGCPESAICDGCHICLIQS